MLLLPASGCRRSSTPARPTPVALEISTPTRPGSTRETPRLNVATGDLIRVETQIGHFVAKVWVTEGIRPGIVACSHHMGRWRLGEPMLQDGDHAGTLNRIASAKVEIEPRGDGKYDMHQIEGSNRSRAMIPTPSGSGGEMPGSTRTWCSRSSPTRSAASTAGTSTSRSPKPGPATATATSTSISSDPARFTSSGRRSPARPPARTTSAARSGTPGPTSPPRRCSSLLRKSVRRWRRIRKGRGNMRSSSNSALT
ncbi:MAG: molybdopterin dinucleotide binding domain-containing protein [Thermomicrobiales bacterium]